MGEVTRVQCQLTTALDALDAAGTNAADAELLAALTAAETARRRLDRFTVTTLNTLTQRGVFAEHGYPNPARALGDLLGWDRHEARRRLSAAEQVIARTGLDGTELPPALPATAAVFAAGGCSLRHVETISRLLGSAAAARLDAGRRHDAEARLAELAGQATPSELREWGTALLDALDQDGAEPDERDPEPVNDLALHRNTAGTGGTLKGRFDDPAMFDAIAALIDAKAKPLTGDDHRSTGQRQAEALADVCGWVLDHGDLPHTGGARPHLNVLIRLDDLQHRCRSAMLDFGGGVTPESLRMLACDAAVIPIVMDGNGQPLDVGRMTRVIPDGLRRAVAARDRGCAYPGCGRPPSWCEIHHIWEWEHGGPTELNNLVSLCRAHHRLLHHCEWVVRIRDGLPEFIPPPWVDPERTPRRRPLPHLVG